MCQIVYNSFDSLVEYLLEVSFFVPLSSLCGTYLHVENENPSDACLNDAFILCGFHRCSEKVETLFRSISDLIVNVLLCI